MAKSMASKSVDAYLVTKERLETFMRDEDVKEVLKELNMYVAEYNSTLDTAIRQVKKHLSTTDKKKLIINGIGAQRKYKRWYNVPLLMETLPADQSDLVVKEEITYSLQTELLEDLVRQGEIDSDIVSKAYVEEELNPALVPGTPKPYTLPPIPVD